MLTDTMQKIRKIAVVNVAPAIRMKFRLKVVDSGDSSAWSESLLLGQHATMKLDGLGFAPGAKIRVEIDLTPIREGDGGTARSESRESVEYDPTSGCVATFIARGTGFNPEAILLD